MSSMKPKGGAKCSRRSHSLWLKRLESRKRVRLARKRFWSQGDLEALTFTESGQVCVREGGSGGGNTSGASSVLSRGSADLPSPLSWPPEPRGSQRTGFLVPWGCPLAGAWGRKPAGEPARGSVYDRTCSMCDRTCSPGRGPRLLFLGGAGREGGGMVRAGKIRHSQESGLCIRAGGPGWWPCPSLPSFKPCPPPPARGWMFGRPAPAQVSLPLPHDLPGLLGAPGQRTSPSHLPPLPRPGSGTCLFLLL